MQKNRIKQIRIANKIKQAPFAEMLGVSQGTLSNWERGIHDPDNETLSKMAQIFDVSIDYLLGYSKDPSSRHKETSVLDDEAMEIIRDMYEREELRTLFSVSRKVKKESIETINKLLEDLAAKDK